MRRLVPAILVGVTIFVAASTAHAAPRALRFTDVLRASVATITIPPEWDGIWVSVDSVYDCTTGFENTEAFLDTLCSGAVFGYDGDDPTGGLITFTCDGTADATTAHVECSGSGEVFPDCTVTVLTTLDAIRTGDSYVAVAVSTITYSGTGFGCDFLTDTCKRVVTRANRSGPAPPAYCATPARPSTWGRVKVRYR
jgi:hypothetical protein